MRLAFKEIVFSVSVMSNVIMLGLTVLTGNVFLAPILLVAQIHRGLIVLKEDASLAW
jgi:hypothetical protein